MGFDLSRIQTELRRRGLDGWLLYDIAHRDPIAYRVLKMAPGMAKRRWFYFIPATGQPEKLVHRVEPRRLDSLPGKKQEYSAWGELQEKLKETLAAARTVAMQYSPQNHIPSVSLADAGTVELVRSFGTEVVSSADLVQQFEARWTPEQYETHKAAGGKIDGIMRAAFAEIGKALKEGRALTEHGLQAWILHRFEEEGLTTEDAPIVAVNENSGDPHFEPSADNRRPIARGDWVLLDIWGKLTRPGAVYYDITWVGYAGDSAPARHREIFQAVRAARDKAVEFVANAVKQGKPIRGFQVDDVARGVIRDRGYGPAFIHRTGHSIGEEVHSTGANMDNLETHDEREIIPGTCFSVEPGIYLPEFGVRLEVDVYVEEGEARPTGAVQTEIVHIL